MKANLIREFFLQFFKSKGHPIVPSSPLIPEGDTTLLFTSAGMVQFKPYYLGLKTDLKRAASCQKCFRTTDIDNVGKTIRHLTFFEMLGNFSFGDYFKEESLLWGYEFLAKEMNIDPKKLWFSYYGGGIAPKDDETFEIWKKILPSYLHSHIFELGEDNFWSMGDTGPSGPSSEIYYDRGEIFHKDCPGPWCGCDRYIEIWNHVFTQFDKQSDGSLKPLPKKNIDTGMGLERLCFIVENKFSPFETTLFYPIIEKLITQFYDMLENKKICDLIMDHIKNKKSYENYYSELKRLKGFDTFIPSIRIISDHIKGSTFLISEGVIPSNEGRGYILRRLIRRASRYARLIGIKDLFLSKLVDCVIEIYGDVYPEIVQNSKNIKNIVEIEERGFIEMIEKGERYINSLLEKGVISGRDAFWIYETYGFPYELIKEIAFKKGIVISDEEFEEAKKKAKEISRKWSSQASDYTIFHSINSKMPKTNFVGYEELETNSKLVALIDENGKELNSFSQGICFLVFEKTPFYAEGGGQVADTGIIKDENDEIVGEVLDVQKPFNDVFYHKVKVIKIISVGLEYKLCVDVSKRKKISANHTATHLLNAALKKVFGEGVVQAGSFVNEEKLRFDYTISSAPTYEELKKVEEIANNAIYCGYRVFKEVRPLSDAKKFGATMLAGEKYSDPARFVLINKDGFSNPLERFSLELCGGTHVDDLKEVFYLKIIKDSSISKGVRRIEAVSGYSLIEYFKNKEEVLNKVLFELEAEENDVLNKINKIKTEIKNLENRVKSLASYSDEIINLDSKKLLITKVDEKDVKLMRNIADKKKLSSSSSVIFIYSISNDKISFILTKTKDLSISLNEIFIKIKDKYNINGGGREDFIQGGGSIVSIEELKEFIAKAIK